MLPRHVRTHGTAGIGGGQAGIILQRVLEQERHAGERSAQRPLELAPRFVLHQPHDGVDAAMDLVLARQRQVEQFVRRHRALRDEGGKGSGVMV